MTDALPLWQEKLLYRLRNYKSSTSNPLLASKEIPVSFLVQIATYRLERLAFWPDPLADRRCIDQSRGTARTDECLAETFPSLLGSYCGENKRETIVSSLSIISKILHQNYRTFGV